MLDITCLTYNEQPVAFRLNPVDEEFLQDVDFTNLDRGLVTVLTSRCETPKEDLYLHEGVLKTKSEINGTLPKEVIDASTSMDAIERLLKEVKEIEGTHLYTKNGSMYVIYSLHIDVTKPNQPLRLRGEYVFSNDSDFEYLLLKGLVDEVDRPTYYPSTLLADCTLYELDWLKEVSYITTLHENVKIYIQGYNLPSKMVLTDSDYTFLPSLTVALEDVLATDSRPLVMEAITLIYDTITYNIRPLDKHLELETLVENTKIVSL